MYFVFCFYQARQKTYQHTRNSLNSQCAGVDRVCRAFRLSIKLVVIKPCYWQKWITGFILANSRVCLLQVERLYLSWWPDRAFRLVASKPCYWLRRIKLFISANSRVCLLQVGRLYTKYNIKERFIADGKLKAIV